MGQCELAGNQMVAGRIHVQIQVLKTSECFLGFHRTRGVRRAHATGKALKLVALYFGLSASFEA